MFLWDGKVQENSKLNYVTMSKKWKYHNIEVAKVKEVSKAIWETLKHTQILDEIEEKENWESKSKFFLTPLQSPSEAKSKSVEYD